MPVSGPPQVPAGQPRRHIAAVVAAQSEMSARPAHSTDTDFGCGADRDERYGWCAGYCPRLPHPREISAGQVGYDLRRLRVHGLITRNHEIAPLLAWLTPALTAA